MTANVALLLIQDGLTSGFIYALLTLTILLVFLVTRVLWIPAGDFLVMGAVSIAMLGRGEAPGTIWIALGLGVLAACAEFVRAAITGQWRGSWRYALACVLPPLVMAPLILWLAPIRPPVAVQIALVLASDQRRWVSPPTGWHSGRSPTAPSWCCYSWRSRCITR